MKLNIISDLHCDIRKDEVQWFDFEPERLEPADFLIVAGDTGFANTERRILAELKERTKGKFRRILAIDGNHSLWKMDDEDYGQDKYENIKPVASRLDVVEGNIAIIGAPLWTNAISRNEVRYMNDYRYIPDFTPSNKLHRYAADSNWLRIKYNEYKERGKKIIIVTHHNPRNSLILPEYSYEHEDVHSAYWVYDAKEDWPDWISEIEKMSFSNFNKGLIKDVSDLKPDIWICGHIHENFDIEHEGTRFIRHPIGYRFGWYKYDKNDPDQKAIMDSWYNKVIEIDNSPTMESENAFYSRMAERNAERQEQSMYD